MNIIKELGNLKGSDDFTMTEALIQQAVEQTHTNYDTYLEGFKELLRIPSISADPEYKPDVQRAADWIVAELQRVGFRNCAAMPTSNHPVVYGEWLEAGDKPTVLVYAHYDVQPVDPLELWESPPFEPEIRDGKLYARGVIDDKCGVYIHLKTFESLLATAGRLPVNVKVFFEGGEESSSPGMEEFIKTHKDLFAADFMLISDGGNPPDHPVNSYGARGIVTAEVIVMGPQYDVHSGALGGVVHNPIHLLAKIIASFHDERGHILIPGFYENVEGFSTEEREYFAEDETERIAEMREMFGDFRIWGEPEYTFDERNTARPTLDVNGIFGGYQGEGDKTIIPAKAGCKASMRIAKDQDPNDIAQKFVDHVMRFTCPTADIEVKISSKSWPVLMMSDSPEIEVLNRAYKAVWGKPAKMERHGGSIPVLGFFQRELDIPMTSMGFGTGGNGHSPNEYMILEYFLKGIDTAIHFYYYLAESRA